MDRGVLWTVTFLAVRRLTDYGWVFDAMSNLEAMTTQTERLHGTGCGVEIGAVTGTASDYPHWAPKRMGSFGEESGAVYVFQRSGITFDQYLQVS